MFINAQFWTCNVCGTRGPEFDGTAEAFLPKHICKHGHDILFDELSPDGPCPGHEHNCVGEDDEETFHGEDHTHRWGWGWTVPFIGCVVAENWDGDLPCGIDSMPIGEYPVDEDWYDDTSVSLTLADAA